MATIGETLVRDGCEIEFFLRGLKTAAISDEVGASIIVNSCLSLVLAVRLRAHGVEVGLAGGGVELGRLAHNEVGPGQFVLLR